MALTTLKTPRQSKYDKLQYALGKDLLKNIELIAQHGAIYALEHAVADIVADLEE